MGSPCSFSCCMPFILSVYYYFIFLPNYARTVRINRKKKLFLFRKSDSILVSLLVCLGQGTFSTVISNCSIEQRNVTKLDRYIITSHSVSGSKCSFTSVIYKYHNLYYPTFFLPKICSPCTYYEYITLLNRRRGGGGGGGEGSHRARSGESSHSLSD